MQAMSPIVMMLVMFGIFYFILIRPQVRKQRDHQAMLSKLGKGDEVITRGGTGGLLHSACCLDPRRIRRERRKNLSPAFPAISALNCWKYHRIAVLRMIP